MSGFFSVGVEEFRAACALSLNSAVAFLVLAAGTGRDNRTTRWSLTAVEKYTGIAWSRAKPAILALREAGLLEIEGSRTRPVYRLVHSEDLIWLPKSLVIPLNGEASVVRRIREMQSVRHLRLYIELFLAQNLAAEGGISRRIACKIFSKHKCYEIGAYIVYGFAESGYIQAGEVDQYTHVHEIFRCEVTDRPDLEAFANAIAVYHSMGLLEYSICAFESLAEDSEMLFPVHGPMDVERCVNLAAWEATESISRRWTDHVNSFEVLLPVYRHRAQVELFGIYRTTHRPNTRLTAAWWAIMNEKVSAAVEDLRRFEDSGSRVINEYQVK